MLAEVGEQLAVLRKALLEPRAVVGVELLHMLGRDSISLAHASQGYPRGQLAMCRQRAMLAT